MARRYWSSLLAILVTVGNVFADIDIETAKITCTHDGFLPHPENCRAFYWCSLRRSSRAIILECDEDQIFDTSSQTCLPPHKSNRRECGGTFGLTNEVEVIDEDQIAEENQQQEQFGLRQFDEPKLTSPSQDDVFSLKISRDLSVQCTQEGFMADEEDCTKFYRCIPNGRGLFQKYNFECGVGTVWDREISACNHPWATRDARCGTMGSNFNSEQSSNPPNNYYPDLNYEQQNNFNNIQPPVNQPPVNNNYNQQPIPQPIDNNYNIQPPYDNPNNIQQQPPNPGNNYNIQQPPPQYVDPNNPGNNYNNMPQYLDPNNPNNIQQPSTSIPDYGNNFQQPPQTFIDPNNPNNNQQQIQPATDNVNNVQQQENNNVQPAGTLGVDCIQEGFMGDSRDCQKFYRCVPNGRGNFMRYEFSCGQGTVWDNELNSCNHIWATRNSNCNGLISGNEPNQQYPINTGFQSTTENNPPSPEIPGPINYPANQQQSNQQIPENQYPGNYPTIPENQQPFYPGNNNQPSNEITQRPPENYPPPPVNQYPNYPSNPANQQPNYPANNNQPSNEITQRPTENYPPPPVNQYPNYPSNPANQQPNYPGNNNQPSYETTPRPPENQPTSEITQRPPENTSGNNPPNPENQQSIPSHETATTNSEAKCTTEDFIHDPKDCKKFYRCVKSGKGFSKYEFSCAEGTVWDRDLKTCNHPESTRKPCGTSSEAVKPETLEPVTSTINPQSTTENSVTASAVSISTAENAVSTVSTVSSTSENKVPESTTSVSTVGPSSTSSELSETSSTRPEITSTNSESSTTSQSTESTNTSSNELLETSSTKPEITSTNPENTTETVPQYDVCTSEGFIGDSKNCKKFYRCVSNNQKTFIKYEFSCGPGTIWDGEQNTCNHPQATRRQCSTMEELSTTESPENNKEISTTTISSIVNNSSTSMSTNNSSISSTTETIEQTTGSTISESDNSSTQIPVQPNVNCTQEGFVPDMNDCKKFYRCVPSGKRFTSYQFTCGEGTVWDSNLETCNHVSEVRNSNCGSGTDDTVTTEQSSSTVSSTEGLTTVGSSESSTGSSTESSSGSTTASSTGSSTENQGASSTEQEKNNESSTTEIQNPSSSTEQSVSTVSSTEGLTTVGSTESSTVPSSTEQEQNNESTTQDPGLTTTTIVPDLSELSNDSSTTVQSSSTTIPSESTSTANIDKNTEQTSTVPSSTDVVSTTLSSENSTSGIESSTISTENTTPLKEIETSSTTSQSTSTNTSPTQSSQSQSSTTTSTTEEPIEVNLLASEICTQEGFFPDMRNCNNFYRCVSNGKGYTKYEFSCAPGTMWDPDLDTCNHPYAVRNKKCGQSQQPVSQKPETGTTSKPGNGTQTDKTPEGSERPETETSAEVCTSVGFYPNRKDCKKFFRCVQNGNGYSKYEFTCGENTIFDPQLQTCNHPYSTVNRACGHSPDKELPSSSTSTESTTVAEVETTTQEQLGGITTEQQTTDSSITTISQTTENLNELTTIQPTTNIIDVTTDIDKLETTTNIDIQTTQQSTDTATDITTENEKEIPVTTENQQTTISDGTTPESSETITQEIVGTTLAATTEIIDSATEQTTLDNREITTELQSTTLDNREITTELQTTTLDNREITTEIQSTTLDNREITTEVQTTESVTDNQQTTIEPLETTTISSATEILSTTPDNREITTEIPSTTPDNREITTEIPTTPDNTEVTTESLSTTPDNREITTEIQTTDSVTDNQQTTIEPIETTTMSSATTTDMDQLVSTTSPEANQSLPCPISELEGDQISLVCPTGFRRHPKYCNLFYQCTHNPDSTDIKILVLSCPKGTIFDEKKIQCLSPEESTQTCTGEIKEQAQFRKGGKSNALPMEINSKQPLCPKEGAYPLHQTKCLNNYIQCHLSAEKQTMRAYMQQCPTGQTYWPISKQCEKQSPILGCSADPTDLSQWMIPVEVKTQPIRK